MDLSTGVDSVIATPEISNSNLVNADAEYAVLGAMLMDRDAIAEAHEIVRPEHFHSQPCRILYEALLSLSARAVEIDPVTLDEELRRNKQIEAVGGTPFIFHVANSVATAANVARHAHIVREKAHARQLLALSDAVRSRLAEPNLDAAELFSWAEGALLGIRDDEAGEVTVRAGELFGQYTEHLETQRKADRRICGYSTGFEALDELCGGFMPGELVILGARPGAGKSAMALNMAQSMARFDPYLQEALPVLFFSLEMTQRQILKRMFAIDTGIHGTKLRHARLDDGEMKRVNTAANRLYDLPLYINDRAGLNALEIRMITQRFKRRHGIRIVFIDYLQIMSGQGRHESRNMDLTNTMQRLQILAKDLNLAVVVLSQLSRNVENREDKRPRLSDLRESGSIEQAANMVVFLHPEEIDGHNTGIVNVLVEKNRDDGCGEVRLSYDGPLTRFAMAG
jgi:replicative DNA helicase